MHDLQQRLLPRGLDHVHSHHVHRRWPGMQLRSRADCLHCDELPELPSELRHLHGLQLRLLFHLGWRRVLHAHFRHRYWERMQPCNSRSVGLRSLELRSVQTGHHSLHVLQHGVLPGGVLLVPTRHRNRHRPGLQLGQRSHRVLSFRMLELSSELRRLHSLQQRVLFHLGGIGVVHSDEQHTGRSRLQPGNPCGRGVHRRGLHELRSEHQHLHQLLVVVLFHLRDRHVHRDRVDSGGPGVRHGEPQNRGLCKRTLSELRRRLSGVQSLQQRLLFGRDQHLHRVRQHSVRPGLLHFAQLDCALRFDRLHELRSELRDLHRVLCELLLRGFGFGQLLAHLFDRFRPGMRSRQQPRGALLFDGLFELPIQHPHLHSLFVRVLLYFEQLFVHCRVEHRVGPRLRHGEPSDRQLLDGQLPELPGDHRRLHSVQQRLLPSRIDHLHSDRFNRIGHGMQLRERSRCLLGLELQQLPRGPYDLSRLQLGLLLPVGRFWQLLANFVDRGRQRM